MLKSLISNILHRYIGVKEPIAPSAADSDTGIVTPSHHKPNWNAKPRSGNPRQSNVPATPDLDGPSGEQSNPRKRHRLKRRKVFDNSFS